jgi:hypothetical protein
MKRKKGGNKQITKKRREKWTKEVAETFWREEGRRLSKLERKVEKKKRNEESMDVIKIEK